MVGAFRPRTLFLNKCERIQVQGLTLRNSPAWVIHPFFSNDLMFANLSIQNPQTSPNTDGLDPESCKNVEIMGVHFLWATIVSQSNREKFIWAKNTKRLPRIFI